MKFIVEIDGVESTRHKYNVWTVFEYEDLAMGKNVRVFSSDSLDEFLEFMKEIEQKS